MKDFGLSDKEKARVFGSNVKESLEFVRRDKCIFFNWLLFSSILHDWIFH